jgi:hypothetical protein
VNFIFFPSRTDFHPQNQTIRRPPIIGFELSTIKIIFKYKFHENERKIRGAVPRINVFCGFSGWRSGFFSCSWWRNNNNSGVAFAVKNHRDEIEH